MTRALYRVVLESGRIVASVARAAWSFPRTALAAALAEAAGILVGYWPLIAGVIALVFIAALWACYAPRSWEQIVAGRLRHRKVSRFLRRSWPTMAQRCGLAVPGDEGPVTAALVKRRPMVWHDDRLNVRIDLPIGLTVDDVITAADRLAAVVSARSAKVAPDGRGARIVFAFSDPLSAAFDAPLPAASASAELDRLPLGRADDGTPIALPLGPQTLLAGASGSGKASLIWSFVAGLAPAIAAGLVEVHAVDLKGGMELSMGAPLFTRFACTPAEAIVLLEDAAAGMQARAHRLSGVTRQHHADADEPLIVVLVDELAAVTAYLVDRDLKSRALMAINLLCSQGRAVGHMMFGALQDPRKETIPARGLFTQMIGLRLKDAEETRMVLGDGAAAAGAKCHLIPRTQPGVGYIVPEDGSAPIRFRAGYVDDDAIRSLATRFPAPRQIPIAVPSPSTEVRPARSRRVSPQAGDAA